MVKLTFSNEQKWHQLRASHIGGSEVAALFEVQPDYMPGKWALWQYKTGFADAPELNSDLVKWGSRLEAPIAHGVAEDNGWEIRKGGYYQDDQCPALGASLDYEIIGGHNKEGNGCLEIKNVNTFNFGKTWTDGEPPIHILLQLQHQLAATGYKWGVIAALRGGCEPYVFHYERDERIISQLRNKITLFWKDVQELNEPKIDNSNHNRKILNHLFSVEDQESPVDLSLDDELEKMCSNFKILSKQRKEIEEQENTLKFAIMRKMGSHSKAIVTGFKVSVSLSKGTEDREALPGEIIKGRSGSRRLTVSELEV